MSAAPLPTPEDDPVETDGPRHASPDGQDGWALLEGLRRRLDDQTSQGRKTQQQVSQLTESIAALVEIQRARTRRINLNSFVAYLVFTVLLGIGFYVLYNSRANELVEAREHADKERDAAVRRADELSAKAVARDEADTRAWEVFQLLEAGKRTEASSKLTALRDLRLSRTERAVLAARAHETQVQEVDAALKAATASFKAGRYAEVIAPLEAALVGEPTGSRAAAMRYFLGIAYAKGGSLEKSVSYLQAALDADVEHEDARFQLASALDRSGAYARARTEYDKFATAHPQSQFAVYAMRRSAALARMPANAPIDPKGADAATDAAKADAAKADAAKADAAKADAAKAQPPAKPPAQLPKPPAAQPPAKPPVAQPPKPAPPKPEIKPEPAPVVEPPAE